MSPKCVDAPETIRVLGLCQRQALRVLVIIFRQPGANIIDTVDRIRAMLPQLKADIPPAIDMRVAMDQTLTIRASVHDVERTLIISVILVILVVFVFLRNARTTFIPSVAVPVSLVGTFGVMYLLGYSLDNLSLMALCISTGFVVDDAIVVIENITRYLEKGMAPFQAALQGAKEIGFTVLTISISLVAVFIPLLLMGGIVGRLFREFAVTLSVAIAVSMVVSLTATPTMCAHLLRQHESHGWLYRTSERAFNWVVKFYGRTLSAVLRFPAITLAVLLATIALNVYLYIHVPKGFFPAAGQRTHRWARFRPTRTPRFKPWTGFCGRWSISWRPTRRWIPSTDLRWRWLPRRRRHQHRRGCSSRSSRPRSEKSLPTWSLRGCGPSLARVPGATLYMQASQDVRVGGRFSAAQYQFTMRGDNLQDLQTFGPRMLQELRTIPIIADVNSDQQNSGLAGLVQYDRATAARFGISSQLIDNALYDAFGERQVSTMYTPLNQYHVVMEVAPEFWQNPLFLRQIYVDCAEWAGGSLERLLAV